MTQFNLNRGKIHRQSDRSVFLWGAIGTVATLASVYYLAQLIVSKYEFSYVIEDKTIIVLLSSIAFVLLLLLMFANKLFLGLSKETR